MSAESMSESEGSISLGSPRTAHQDSSDNLQRKTAASPNRRVLAVDDDPNVTSSIYCNLHGRFTLMTANSGTGALDILGDTNPNSICDSGRSVTSKRILAGSRNRLPAQQSIVPWATSTSRGAGGMEPQ